MSDTATPPHWVRTTRRDRIAILHIERPDARNALNLEVKRQLQAALSTAEADEGVAVIIVTGSPAWFVSGSDIAEMKDLSPADHKRLGTGAVFEQLRACSRLTIAAVEGYAFGGGCELALACDMIVAGRGARFGQPEILVGIMPGAGATQILLRVAGKYRAMRMMLTGEPILAEEALALGLVSHTVEDGEALNEALALAAKIVSRPPLAVRAIKEAVRFGMDATFSAAVAHERGLFEQLFASEDQVEGMQAFLDKRPPRYQGR